MVIPPRNLKDSLRTQERLKSWLSQYCMIQCNFKGEQGVI